MSGLLWPVSTTKPISLGFGVPFAGEAGAFLEKDAVGTKRTLTMSLGGVYIPEIHKGTDIVVPIGTQVKAAENGIIVAEGVWPSGARYCMLQIRPGTIAYYTHLSKTLFNIGTKVTRGQVICLSGNSGGVHPHLHFEVRTGPSTTFTASFTSFWYHWNALRLRTGGDLADIAEIKPL